MLCYVMLCYVMLLIRTRHKFTRVARHRGYFILLQMLSLIATGFSKPRYIVET